MDADRYPLHHRSEVDIDADVHSLFAHLDDHRRLVGHMEKRSLMMAGATMRVETDALQGKAVGSLIRVTGRVFGMDLAVEEVVTERLVPWNKTWETRGEPRLLVIGAYRINSRPGSTQRRAKPNSSLSSVSFHDHAIWNCNSHEFWTAARKSTTWSSWSGNEPHRLHNCSTRSVTCAAARAH